MTEPKAHADRITELERAVEVLKFTTINLGQRIAKIERALVRLSDGNWQPAVPERREPLPEEQVAHDPACAFVTSSGTAPCNCGAVEAATKGEAP